MSDKTYTPPSVALTENFYNWERRGRGWAIYTEPVELEPAFVPFPGHILPSTSSAGRDDGREHTLLSRLSERVRTFIVGEEEVSADNEEESDNSEEIPQPIFKNPGEALKEFHIVLPHDSSLTPELMRTLLSNLNYTKYPLSFEVIGTLDEIVIQLCAYESDAQALRDQIPAYIPEIELVDRSGYLDARWNGYAPMACVDFGLEHECMLPLQIVSTYRVDPLIGITAAMSNLLKGELGILQVLFQPVRHNWGQEFLDAVTDWDGSAFFQDAPQMLPLTKDKISSPLYATAVRVAAFGDNPWNIVKNLSATLSQFSAPPSNSLMPLENDDFSDADYERRIVNRQSYRPGMILNAQELVSLVHAPDASVTTNKVQRRNKKTKAAPALTQGHALHIGTNEHRSETMDVSLSQTQRMRHMYLIGSSGTGKSTMFLNMIRQDMTHGNGIAVFDPHGDLIDTILQYVPDERMADVIVFDPSDNEYPIGFNIIDAHSELEKTLLASDLVSVFKRLSSSWGDQMNSVLANGISAMLESREGGTLPILRRFLVDQQFRKEFLTSVEDPEIVFYWEREFPLLSGKPQGPVLTRLDTFLRPKPIRNMVAQKENKIDFSHFMQDRKIFLAKLAQGAIGAENSYLLGAFLVTKLNQIAFSRQDLSQSERNDFYLYVDEFHNFLTPSMESILSGARKYNVGLILAHQELRQLESRDQDVAASVISNPYTRVCFRLGDNDAKRLQSGFQTFNAQDLQSLGIGEAIVRVERAEYDFNLKTPQLPKIDEKHAATKRRQIIEHSRKTYGTPREEVERLLYEAIGGEQPKKESKQKTAHNLEKEKPLSSPGRGGKKHKAIQERLKTVAKKLGFGAKLEHHIGDGKTIDLVITMPEKSIACEISMSTSVRHEMANLVKCSEAGFNSILLVSEDTNFTLNLQKALGKQDLKDVDVIIRTPEEAEKYIQSLSFKKTRELVVRGRRVKTQWCKISEEERERREIVVGKVVVG